MQKYKQKVNKYCNISKNPQSIYIEYSTDCIMGFELFFSFSYDVTRMIW